LFTPLGIQSHNDIDYSIVNILGENIENSPLPPYNFIMPPNGFLQEKSNTAFNLFLKKISWDSSKNP